MDLDDNGQSEVIISDNIDADPDLKVVLTTLHSGIIAYELPNTAKEKYFWSAGSGYSVNALENVKSIIIKSSILGREENLEFLMVNRKVSQH